jgi:hypothetical protein
MKLAVILRYVSDVGEKGVRFDYRVRDTGEGKEYDRVRMIEVPRTWALFGLALWLIDKTRDTRVTTAVSNLRASLPSERHRISSFSRSTTSVNAWFTTYGRMRSDER